MISNSNEPWKEAGITGRTRIERLLYNRSSEKLIAVVLEELEEVPVLARLYYRCVGESTYRPVPTQNILDSYADAVSCDDSGFVVYNVMRYRPPTPGVREFGADWIGVSRFNLLTGYSEIVVDASKIRPALPYASGWVSSILSAHADGSGAICSVGLEKSGEDGAIVDLEYFVFEVSFTRGLVREIAALPNVFL